LHESIGSFSARGSLSFLVVVLFDISVIASSWDLDGNGIVDTIQVLTKQHAIEMTDKYSIGNTTQHITTKREARSLADTLVSSTQSLWSLPGYTITAKVRRLPNFLNYLDLQIFR